MEPTDYRPTVRVTSHRGGSRILERGGSRRGYRIFHKHPPPLDIVRVTSSDLRKFEKHPHSWTFTSTPPLDIVCVTSSAIRKIEKHPHSWTFTKGGGPTLGPNVKKPTLWPKRGGSGPPGPPPWIRHCHTCVSLSRSRRPLSMTTGGRCQDHSDNTTPHIIE